MRMDNKTKPGAYPANMGGNSEDKDRESFIRSVNMVLAGLQAVVSYATRRGDVQSFEAMQTVCGKTFKRAAEAFEIGGNAQ